MAVPKTRTSKSKKGMRRSHLNFRCNTQRHNITSAFKHFFNPETNHNVKISKRVRKIINKA